MPRLTSLRSTPDARVGRAAARSRVGGAVGARVVDDDDLPRRAPSASRRVAHRLDRGDDPGGLVVGGNDDGEPGAAAPRAVVASVALAAKLARSWSATLRHLRRRGCASRHPARADAPSPRRLRADLPRRRRPRRPLPLPALRDGAAARAAHGAALLDLYRDMADDAYLDEEAGRRATARRLLRRVERRAAARAAARGRLRPRAAARRGARARLGRSRARARGGGAGARARRAGPRRARGTLDELDPAARRASTRS